MRTMRTMIGAIVGDVVGSRWEFGGCKTKDFVFLDAKCEPTDDTILTLAVGDALLGSHGKIDALSAYASSKLKEWSLRYPFADYGEMFARWVLEGGKEPYNSWGNGSAMRVSFCGWAAGSLDEAKALSDAVTSVTHNHPEGMSGAAIVAECIYLAKTGCGMDEIRRYVECQYCPLDFSLDSIRDSYSFDVSCRGSVPQALEAFFESTSFEDAIRNAISIGGDSDTIGAICGGIAGAYWGVPEGIRNATRVFLDNCQKEMLSSCERMWCT